MSIRDEPEKERNGSRREEARDNMYQKTLKY